MGIPINPTGSGEIITTPKIITAAFKGLIFANVSRGKQIKRKIIITTAGKTGTMITITASRG
jgi:hypothetical protein